MAPDLVADLDPDLAPDLVTDLAPDLVTDLVTDLAAGLVPDLVTDLAYFAAHVSHLTHCDRTWAMVWCPT